MFNLQLFAFFPFQFSKHLNLTQSESLFLYISTIYLSCSTLAPPLIFCCFQKQNRAKIIKSIKFGKNNKRHIKCQPTNRVINSTNFILGIDKERYCVKIELPTKKERKMNKTQQERMRRAKRDMVIHRESEEMKSSYERDKDGFLVRIKTYHNPDGTVTQSQSRVAAGAYQGTRSTYEAKENAYRATLERMINAILTDKSEEEIEKFILQTEHPQMRVFDALEKKHSSVQDKELLISLIIEEEIVDHARENIDKIVERLRKSPRVANNYCVTMALDALSLPEDVEEKQI